MVLGRFGVPGGDLCRLLYVFQEGAAVKAMREDTSLTLILLPSTHITHFRGVQRGIGGFIKAFFVSI
jgi:hypothetical protein